MDSSIARLGMGKGSRVAGTAGHPRRSTLGERKKIGDLLVLAKQTQPEIFPPGNILTVVERTFNASVASFEPEIENARALFEARTVRANVKRCGDGAHAGSHTEPPILSTCPQTHSGGRVGRFTPRLQAFDEGRGVPPEQVLGIAAEEFLRFAVELLV